MNEEEVEKPINDVNNESLLGEPVSKKRRLTYTCISPRDTAQSAFEASDVLLRTPPHSRSTYSFLRSNSSFTPTPLRIAAPFFLHLFSILITAFEFNLN